MNIAAGLTPFEELQSFIRYALTCENSYAGGGTAMPIIPTPGWKGFRVEDRDRGYVLVDVYWTNSETGMSGGYICAWKGGKIVMYMTYGGSYPKEVTPFLRKALLAGMHGETFSGFRGPADFTNEEGLHYKNQYSGTHSQFWGEEYIRSSGRKGDRGYHMYQGWMHI